MITKEFLTENRVEIITFFNENVNNYYNVTAKEFMTDLLNNFRKITLSEGLKKTDLMGNLIEAKSRLGLMSQNNFTYAEDKKTKALENKYAGTCYMSIV